MAKTIKSIEGSLVPGLGKIKEIRLWAADRYEEPSVVTGNGIE